eukprot:31524-Pelagococcus_subviridis.AAC.7
MVRDTSRRATCRPSEEISWPTENEMSKKLHKREWALPYAMVCSRVVNCVRSLPAEIRNQEKRMKCVTNKILNETIVRKCIVPTFVCDHPAASGNGAGDSSVCQPYWPKVQA